MDNFNRRLRINLSQQFERCAQVNGTDTRRIANWIIQFIAQVDESYNKALDITCDALSISISPIIMTMDKSKCSVEQPKTETKRDESQMDEMKAKLDNWFKFHSPTEEQKVKYIAIREAALNLATVIVENTPPSADQSAAIRHVREACMTANAAVACDGK